MVHQDELEDGGITPLGFVEVMAMNRLALASRLVRAFSAPAARRRSQLLTLAVLVLLATTLPTSAFARYAASYNFV